MRVGLIARADSRGLGIQTKAFYDHMHPAKTLVVDCPSVQPLPVRRDWYPDGVWTGIPTMSDIEDFLEDVDVVFTAETGYTPALWDIAEKRGIKTVLQANFEFLDRSDRPSLWVAPSLWRFDEWPEGAVHLPVPVEVERFPPAVLPQLPTRLLHIVGRPTLDRKTDLCRNGTIDFLTALQHVTLPVTVTIRCQHETYVNELMARHGIRVPDNIDLRVIPGDTPNYWDNYEGQHALIMPRRFGGLCLPANEAIAAGIPVIMPDIDPNNTWLPKEWLVPASQVGAFRAKQVIDLYAVDPIMLSVKIHQILTDAQWYEQAKRRAQKLRWRLSWDALKPYYEEVLA